jgi:hypothetical protein
MQEWCSNPFHAINSPIMRRVITFRFGETAYTRVAVLASWEGWGDYAIEERGRG